VAHRLQGIEESQDDLRGEIADGQAIDRALVPVGGEPQESLQGIAIRERRVAAHVALGAQVGAEEVGHESRQLR
jgi:hypothetical protein